MLYQDIRRGCRMYHQNDDSSYGNYIAKYTKPLTAMCKNSAGGITPAR